MKKLCSVLLVTIVMFCISACKNEEANVPYKLIVSCQEVVENFDDEAYGIKPEKRDFVPADGIILELEANCSEGSNVYEIVKNNLKSKKLHFDGSDGYFTAIGNIYAGDCGDFSGWMFFINGNLAEFGASDTLICENDIIEFKYIVDYNSIFE